MKKAKRLMTATLVVLLLGSLAGCIVYDRGGYRRHDGSGYGYGYGYRDRGWDRR